MTQTVLLYYNSRKNNYGHRRSFKVREECICECVLFVEFQQQNIKFCQEAKTELNKCLHEDISGIC